MFTLLHIFINLILTVTLCGSAVILGLPGKKSDVLPKLSNLFRVIELINGRAKI